MKYNLFHGYTQHFTTPISFKLVKIINKTASVFSNKNLLYNSKFKLTK